MSAQEIIDIEIEIVRLTVLCDQCLEKSHYLQYNHFRTRIQDLNIVLKALKDLDDRII